MNPTTTGTVLVVDDQERNVQVLGTTLSNAGFQVMAASGGQQALKRVADHVPDLVLLDILMPGMDGFEVCKRLQSDPETAGLPVIFISAADEGDVIVRALAAGGVDYVTKPFNSDELLARVRTDRTRILCRRSDLPPPAGGGAQADHDRMGAVGSGCVGSGRR